MASKHFPPPTPLYPSRAAPGSSSSSDVLSQSFEEENVHDEDRVLCLLLEAFPGISHETLAIAYARAERDPNRAAEILSAETTEMTSDESGRTSIAVDVWEPPNQNPEKRFLGEEFGSSAENGRAHSDDFRSNGADTHQLKNGHGDFAGASVWRDTRLHGNHCRPPESSTQPNSPEEDDNGAFSFPAPRRKNGARSGKANWATRSSSAPPKLSAVIGSVSNRMQRRGSASSASSANGSGSQSAAQKDVRTGGEEEEERRKAAEEFLNSMLGGDFGIDLVRDVLAHYGGDTEKALETLLNIGSSSTGFDYGRGGPGNAVDPLYCPPGDQNGDNADVKPTPTGLLHDTAGLSLETADHEVFCEGVRPREENRRRTLLVMLCNDFPIVEQSFLSQVLQAAEFSYHGALEILKESGLTPAAEQNSKPKLDPNEVLQALFRTDNEPPTVTERFGEPQSTTEEPWTVVAAKPKPIRNPDMQQNQRLRSGANEDLDEYNEYYRQRASANEHWETMKMYLKEANAAYNRGDRARAGLLSEKGTKFKELARTASNRASQNIFNVRNKNLPNNITIDLHSQHVTEALSLLELHLRTLSQIPSVNGLTVITGQGSHSAGGQAKIKLAITKYLDRKEIPWTQENPGCMVIKMSDVRRSNSGRGDADSYSDSE